MKTARKWFEEVEEPALKARLLEIFKNQYILARKDDLYKDVFEAIHKGIYYASSYEGELFWQTIIEQKSFDHFYTSYKAKKITKLELNTGQIPVVLLAKNDNSGSDGTTGVKYNEGKLPYYTVLIEQFPLAIQALVKRSEYGHQKYLKDDKNYDNWKRVPDAHKAYRDALIRHLFNDGELHETKIDHLTAALWNICAVLQLELEKDDK